MKLSNQKIVRVALLLVLGSGQQYWLGLVYVLDGFKPSGQYWIVIFCSIYDCQRKIGL